MYLPLFTNGDALLWLVIVLAAMVVLIYFPLFLLFFKVCRLSGPSAIRWAWTVGLLLFLVYVGLSERRAQYLIFWRGEVGMFDVALLTLLALVFLVFICWVKRPQLES